MKQVKLVGTDICCLVDDEDFEIVNRHIWYHFPYKRSSYAKAIVEKKWIGMHTFIYPPHSNLTVDHINGDGLDNQKINLRHATLNQQRRNTKKHLNSTSKYKGVSYSKRDGLWVAQIYINGKQTCIGRYMDEDDAARAYNWKAQEYFGEFAKLNFAPYKKSLTN